MSKRKASFFLFEKEPRPVSLERFADIELAIRSLRNMVGESVVVDFKDKCNNLGFIQAAASVDYKEHHIEIAFDVPDKKVPDIYAKNDAPVEETVEVFRNVCTKTDMPNLDGWALANFEIFDEEGKLLHPGDD